jgi:hypothetical protein
LQARLESLAEEPVRFLYAYQGYNLVSVGPLYVAADQRLGAIDIPDTLKKDPAARPSSEQFIVAHNLWVLKAWITYFHVLNPKRVLNKFWGKSHT